METNNRGRLSTLTFPWLRVPSSRSQSLNSSTTRASSTWYVVLLSICSTLTLIDVSFADNASRFIYYFTFPPPQIIPHIPVLTHGL